MILYIVYIYRYFQYQISRSDIVRGVCVQRSDTWRIGHILILGNGGAVFFFGVEVENILQFTVSLLVYSFRPTMASSVFQYQEYSFFSFFFFFF